MLSEIETLQTAADELVRTALAIRASIAALSALPVLNTPVTVTPGTPGTPATVATNAPFRQKSEALHKTLSKEERQAQGIFFTPKPIRDRLMEVLDLHGVAPTSILEPSFGSGEFLYDAHAKYPAATLYGVEKNPALYASVALPGARLTEADFLAYPPTPVDLILGNPPYFVTKAKDPACMTGRGNIYVQFLYACVTKHLNPDGVLAFVLPTSFYNCAYYQPCRNALRRSTTILHCEQLSGGFYETAQDTMLLVLRNRPSADASYFVTIREQALLSPHYRELEALLRGSTTLEALGFQVKTGEVVWNEHKEDLHDTVGTLLLYSGNIVDNHIALKATMTGGKKQYLQKCRKDPVRGPAIAVCRGYGNAFHLSYASIPETLTFYGENHLNVITPATEAAAARIPQVLASFADPRTADFLRMFVGNGALSKTELESVLPIFCERG
jgi:adenine-specific DNA-methyltransferase